ncbi:hypothetical protein BJQ94_13805 [Cryobacterium sp. SO2]|uniref:hypothetical protein n=1 Tax=Cryobacterium sp. SO2 TaxID=1897060 RepID=UPI00223E1636|nr:hypothetical protein [Cryobacterium sp. SO2]WEO76433.1 hypothetical protein BJQ94_13805 [Cryobacterium sp. SO2]
MLDTSGAPSVMVVMASMKDGDDTMTLFGSTADDAHFVESYDFQFIDGEASLDNLTLAWMAGMDHWFANPTWWRELPEEVKREILRELSTI